MDGFHLADAEVERLGLRDRKGAIDTFDAYGYLELLQRIRTQAGEIVYAPAFDRHIEQPIAGSIAVPPHARLVEFGKSPERAEAWVNTVDEPNAERIERVRHKADLVVAG